MVLLPIGIILCGGVAKLIEGHFYRQNNIHENSTTLETMFSLIV